MNAKWWMVAVVLLAGCVSQSKYDEAVRQADEAKKRNDDSSQKLKEAVATNEKLKADLGIAQSKMTTDEQKAQLEEAKRAIADAEARAKLQADLVAKLQKEIDAGHLKITVRRNQLVLALHNDVLFDTGETDIKPDGKKAINEVALALRSLTGKRFQVAGHTDTAPIVSAKKKEFPTNWELSTARAVAVVKLLTTYGVNPGALSAAGYGPYDPVAPNATPDGQAKNRRIEVTLQPNVGDIAKDIVPDKVATDKPAEKKP